VDDATRGRLDSLQRRFKVRDQIKHQATKRTRASQMLRGPTCESEEVDKVRQWLDGTCHYDRQSIWPWGFAGLDTPLAAIDAGAGLARTNR
jgi:hypothetical protein